MKQEEEMVDGLLGQFLRLNRMLHHWHQRNHLAHGPMGNPHRGQGRILQLLKMKPEIGQRELSYLLDMRPQSLGELLGKLERNGFITRTPSEDDRRAMNIKLTDAGVEAANPEESLSPLAGIFDCLTEEEQKNLGGYLERVCEGLEQLLGDCSCDAEMHGRHGRHGCGSREHHGRECGSPEHHRGHRGCGQDEHGAHSGCGEEHHGAHSGCDEERHGHCCGE